MAGLGLYMFVVHMMTHRTPFIEPGLFKDRNLVVGLVFIFLIGIILLATLALLPPFLQGLMGYPVVTTGLVLAPRGIGSMFSMMLVGRLIKSSMSALLIFTGLCLTALSLWQMSGFTTEVSSLMVASSGIVQGLGLGLIFVPLSTITFATLAPHYRTEATAMFSLMRNIGSSIGISIMVTLVARNTQINHAVLGESLTPARDAFQNLQLPGGLDPMSTQGLALSQPVADRAGGDHRLPGRFPPDGLDHPGRDPSTDVVARARTSKAIGKARPRRRPQRAGAGPGVNSTGPRARPPFATWSIAADNQERSSGQAPEHYRCFGDPHDDVVPHLSAVRRPEPWTWSLALPAAAEIYKHVDSQGNVTFSDKPGDDGTKVDLQPLPTISLPKGTADMTQGLPAKSNKHHATAPPTRRSCSPLRLTTVVSGAAMATSCCPWKPILVAPGRSLYRLPRRQIPGHQYLRRLPHRPPRSRHPYR